MFPVNNEITNSQTKWLNIRIRLSFHRICIQERVFLEYNTMVSEHRGLKLETCGRDHKLEDDILKLELTISNSRTTSSLSVLASIANHSSIVILRFMFCGYIYGKKKILCFWLQFSVKTDATTRIFFVLFFCMSILCGISLKESHLSWYLL